MSNARGGGISLLFMILLFFALGIFSVVTVITGARVYENINTRAEDNFRGQTVLSYITHKVRQADEKGMISVEIIQGVDVLILKEEYQSLEYQTMIYSIDGQLKELFTQVDSGLGLSDGIEIMDCKKLNFSFVSNNLIKVKLEEGKVDLMHIALRSGSEGGE